MAKADSPITVFVSYTQETPAHNGRVLALSNDLRAAGFDCEIDQYHVNQDWPAWMERSIANARFVLVVCSPTYLRRWNNDEKPGLGLGAQWESLLTRQHLYMEPGNNDKFVPIVLHTEHIQCIPLPLSNVTRIDLSKSDGFHSLRCRLLGISPATKPPIRTSLAPISLADGFFLSSVSTGDIVAAQLSFGLVDKQEELVSNLFPVSFASKMNTAQIKLKHHIRPQTHFEQIWKSSGNGTPPPVDYFIEHSTLYTFGSFTSPFWQKVIASKSVQPQGSIPTSTWSNSTSLADKNRFVKLLNHCLDQLCANSEMEHSLAWSKGMKCHLFRAAPGKRSGHIRVPAITKMGDREVYRAIPDKLSSNPYAIQHWKHQAFRHEFVRFADRWHLLVIPFWAFTEDGWEKPSRWQKSSSANMKRPERNRAVLGHVAFWASILCREDDLLRKDQLFKVSRPSRLLVSPAIDDAAWMNIAKEQDKLELQTDFRKEEDLCLS